MSRFVPYLVPLSAPADVLDPVAEILNDTWRAGLVRWWDLPGLAKFAPPNDPEQNFGWFALFAQSDPPRYLRLLEQLNHVGNRGGSYTSYAAIPEFDAWINWGWPEFATKANAAWRWIWAMPPYSGRVAATNVGVVYIQMKAEAAARAAQAQAVAQGRNQAEAAAAGDAARRQGAYDAGEFSLDYQQYSARDQVDTMAVDATAAVERNQVVVDALKIAKAPADALVSTAGSAVKGVQGALESMGWWFWPAVIALGYAAIRAKR